MRKTVLVTGAGGFIGGHLVARLRDQRGVRVRAVDVKPLERWHQRFPDIENVQLDLSLRDACYRATEGVNDVYNLAADMGGMGFIETHKALCMLSVLIDTHMLLASRDLGVERYFYASSACVYPAYKQNAPDVPALRESDAYPAMPEDGYGWEKLFGERMSRHFSEDFGLCTHVARFHNVYGPHSAYEGGREKAPAAICRKIIEAKLSGRRDIEIWGDGTRTRSFMYIDDCIHGILAIMDSDIRQPVNLGSNELVTIDQLVDVIEDIAGVRLERRYNRRAPQGVSGRNSDNSLLLEHLGWAPLIPLRAGLERTYYWIYRQVTGCVDTNASV